MRFQEDSLGTAGRRVLVDVLAVVLVHRCSVALLCKFLFYAGDEALIPGEEEEQEEVEESERDSTHFWENSAPDFLLLNQ